MTAQTALLSDDDCYLARAVLSQQITVTNRRLQLHGGVDVNATIAQLKALARRVSERRCGAA